MEISNTELDDFQTFFTGNDKAHGVFIPDTRDSGPGVKVEGKAFTTVETVSSDNYLQHLKGEKGLGIVPIRADGTCTFAVLDVDAYDGSYNKIIRAIYKYTLPLVPFRSKSGGLHLYLFLESVVDVKAVLKVMIQYRKLFQLDKSTEIFPKQNMLKEGEVGNWINIPYFDIERTRNYALSSTGEAYDFSSALDLIRSKRIAFSKLATLNEGIPLFDGPPCLQSIYVLGDTSNRNQYLFSLARYYKAVKGDDFEFAIMEANNELDHPLKVEEISDTIIKTHKKKNYSYKCQEEPICSICDKTECKTRKYGIGGAEVSDISYEEFIQYGIEEPTYEWIINGTPLTFLNEEDIINQTEFRKLCFRKLHILPFKITDFSWTEIINTALHNIIVKNEEETAGLSISHYQLFKEHLIEFLTKRALAATQEQVLVDRVYRDEELKGYVFKPKNLNVFLVHQKQFRAYGVQEIGDKLKKMGAYPKMYYIVKSKKSVRTWIMPFEGLGKDVEEDFNDVEIDFLDEVKKEDY